MSVLYVAVGVGKKKYLDINAKIMAPFAYSFYYTCLVIGVTDFQVSPVDRKCTC